ncbi:hypothetical protein ASG25_15700 [Rhizobium sp. Leaf384]|uniref:hypothetical protein n=1 Tax=unclassified Rhizobium TaxID=2613769 RepID=UPI000713F62B|nr:MULTISPECIES: hypothetical protein [unclassified Rhizobium]KQR69078.1 hypothetical protein ASG03_07640 [Rhizobium sp. Leaf341]KQS76859.1 hypothetical protein ASG25_15700 [Rhizobium sp. Leaf384]KQS78130.1 hypothetical protein ASG58_06915 [Rhizobium sp. Leaf383]
MTSNDIQQLRLYRLVPSARPDDPGYGNAPSQGEIVVRALSPADARIVAAEAELDFTEIDAKPAEGTDTRMASVFRNEKLYTVIEEAISPALRNEGERGVVQGTVSVGTIRPTQV